MGVTMFKIAMATAVVLALALALPDAPLVAFFG
jgi:hypothetical protein